MWSSTPKSQAGPRRPAEFAVMQPRSYDGLWSLALHGVLIGALVFNFLLCFVNTRIMPVGNSHVVLAEMALIATAAVLALDRRPGFYMLLALYLTYMLLVLALRGVLDPKSVRDGLIPIVFYFLGRRIPDLGVVDRIVLASAGIVVAVGLFEYLALDLFVANFNIIDYYIARGTVREGEFFDDGSGLFISGMRPGGRNILSFLGDHRISSVFLEPVSMGNFGAFLALWALFRTDMRHRSLLFAAAAAVIILGDARFGMFVCFAYAGVVLTYRFVPPLIWWLLPALIAFALVLYAGTSPLLVWEDNLSGRMLSSGRMLINLGWAGVFGVSTSGEFVADSGYAYSLDQIGLIGIVFLWTMMLAAPVRSREVWRLRALIVTYVCLLMVVSNSLYSIKTAALLWLCVGAADVWPGTAARETPASPTNPSGPQGRGKDAPPPSRLQQRVREAVSGRRHQSAAR